MAERKETPDVLGELLGGSLPAPEPNTPPRADPPARPVTPKASTPAKPVAAPSEPKPALKLAPPKAPKPAPSSIQWEYTQVIFHEYDGWRPRFRDGAELAHWKQGPGIDACLRQMGDQGWELAGIVPGQRNQWHAFFKRPQS